MVNVETPNLLPVIQTHDSRQVDKKGKPDARRERYNTHHRPSSETSPISATTLLRAKEHGKNWIETLQKCIAKTHQ
jgi:hypothetical protein